MYVIYSNEGYYTGNTYFYQSEKYAVFDKDVTKAKKYKSIKRCENDYCSLERTCSNCSDCSVGIYVKEVKDDG